MHLLTRNPLAVLLSVVFVCALFSLPAINYFSLRDEILYGIQERELPLTSDNIYSALQQDFIRPKLIADLMAKDPLVINWLNTGETDLESIFAMLQQRRIDSGATTTFLASEKTRRYFHDKGAIENLTEKNLHDSWYFNFRDGNKSIDTNIGPDHTDPQHSITYINIKIIDKTQKLIGVTGIGFRNEYLKSLLRNYQDKFAAQVFLVNKQKRIVVSHSHIGKNGIELLSLAGYASVGNDIFDKKNHFFTIEYGNSQYAIQTRYLPELEAYLFVERNIDKILQGAQKTLINNLLICTLITLISLPLILITLGRYQRDLEKSASTDALTQLLNRHAFVPIVENAIHIANRNALPMCILLIDVDFFKKINDSHGHLFGDATLSQLAKILTERLRKSDSICRWGGEEFIVLLKETDSETGKALAEQIRETVANTPITFNNKKIAITISIGIANYCKNETMSQWLERGDNALYQAKNSGRNRCIIAD